MLLAYAEGWSFSRSHRRAGAANLGLGSGILLVATLISATLNFVLPQLGFLKHLTMALAVVGMVLIIGGAAVVLADNTLAYRASNEEAADVPDIP